jgi:hypothetical protein
MDPQNDPPRATSSSVSGTTHPSGASGGGGGGGAAGDIARSDVDPSSPAGGVASRGSHGAAAAALPPHSSQPRRDDVRGADWRETTTSPAVNLWYLVDKIKSAYEDGNLEAPAEVLELHTELRRLEWEQRLQCVVPALCLRCARAVYVLCLRCVCVCHVPALCLC